MYTAAANAASIQRFLDQPPCLGTVCVVFFLGGMRELQTNLSRVRHVLIASLKEEKKRKKDEHRAPAVVYDEP